MTDNTTLNTGSGGDVIATDDISGVKHQRVKVEFGADGTASDVSVTNPLPIQELHASTAAVTSVNSSATSVTLLSLTAGRFSALFFNDSTAVLYIKFGTTASTSDYTVQVQPGGYYELPMPCYTGRIDGIWASANGACKITELTV